MNADVIPLVVGGFPFFSLPLGFNQRLYLPVSNHFVGSAVQILLFLNIDGV
jgi:hypothetical protein